MSESNPTTSLPGEEWRPVVGYEGRYEVSNLGRVASLRYGRWKQGRRLLHQSTLKNSGYKVVTIFLAAGGKGKMKKVHHLVLDAFDKPCPDAHLIRGRTHETRHLDGDESNNCIKNLCWGTRKENAEDKRLHGTLPLGTDISTATLDGATVLAIFKSRGAVKTIAERFGVSEQCAGNVYHRRSWTWLTDGLKNGNEDLALGIEVGGSSTEEILATYAILKNQSVVARVLGTTRQRVWKTVKNAGIESRRWVSSTTLGAPIPPGMIVS